MQTESFDRPINAYQLALNSLNVEAYVNLFTTDCTVHDPYGGAEYVGIEGLREYFATLQKTWQYFEMRFDNIYRGGAERLAVRWSVSSTAKNRKTAEYNGISIFILKNEKISRLEAYWNREAVFRQITG